MRRYGACSNMGSMQRPDACSPGSSMTYYIYGAFILKKPAAICFSCRTQRPNGQQVGKHSHINGREPESWLRTFLLEVPAAQTSGNLPRACLPCAIRAATRSIECAWFRRLQKLSHRTLVASVAKLKAGNGGNSVSVRLHSCQLANMSSRLSMEATSHRIADDYAIPFRRPGTILLIKG
jgi:hypothetical protein